MKLLLLFVGGVGLGLPLLAIPTAWAESRRPAEATAHALDELANVCAQRRPECPTATPTLTLTPTWTPSPTSTSTPVPPPTDIPPAPTTTPETCWLTNQDLGDPDNGYIVFSVDGAPMPCPVQDAQEGPTDTPESTAAPTPTDLKQAPRVAQPPAPAAAAPREVIVVETVIVTAQPVDTATPMPTAAPVRVVVETPPTPAAAPTAHPTPTVQPPTITPTARATVAIVSASTAPRMSANRPAERSWLYVSVLACLGLAAVAAAWLVYRGRRRFAP